MEKMRQKRADQREDSWPERFLTSIAMIATGALCVIVTTIVISRWFYQPLIPDDVYLVSELMIAVVLLPLASITRRHMHIEVTVFTDWTSENCKKKLSVLGHVIGLLFVGLLLWAGTRSLVGALETGEYYDGNISIPTWIGYALYVSGLCACFLRLLLFVAFPQRNEESPGA